MRDVRGELLHGDPQQKQQLRSRLVLAVQHPLLCRQAIQVTAGSEASGLAFT